MSDDTARRSVRSFVLRAGRITVAQTRALEHLWPVWGVEPGNAAVDWNAVFARDTAKTLEIGFGNGEALLELAAKAPDSDFIGVDVHPPGVGHLLAGIERLGLTNVRVLRGDAIGFLKTAFTPESLDRILVWFPDPWPKKRHHKRRLVTAEFLELVASRLKPGGILHLATDWQDYAEHMLDALDRHMAFENSAGPGAYSARPDWRPATKFEQRGLRLGHGVWDLIARRRHN